MEIASKATLSVAQLRRREPVGPVNVVRVVDMLAQKNQLSPVVLGLAPEFRPAPHRLAGS
jgi:hypothetical protein